MGRWRRPWPHSLRTSSGSTALWSKRRRGGTPSTPAWQGVWLALNNPPSNNHTGPIWAQVQISVTPRILRNYGPTHTPQIKALPKETHNNHLRRIQISALRGFVVVTGGWEAQRKIAKECYNYKEKGLHLREIWPSFYVGLVGTPSFWRRLEISAQHIIPSFLAHMFLVCLFTPSIHPLQTTISNRFF